MNEAIKNLVVLMWTVSAINTNADTQAMTVYAVKKEPVAVVSAPVSDEGKKHRRENLTAEQNGGSVLPRTGRAST